MAMPLAPLSCPFVEPLAAQFTHSGPPLCNSLTIRFNSSFPFPITVSFATGHSSEPNSLDLSLAQDGCKRVFPKRVSEHGHTHALSLRLPVHTLSKVLSLLPPVRAGRTRDNPKQPRGPSL